MRTLIIILIIASFLQTTIIPIDLVLLILICRAYIRSGKENFYLAFAFGLLVAHLNTVSLGLQSIIYMFIVLMTESLSKIRLAGNPLLIVPVSMVFLFLNQVIFSLVNHQSLEISNIISASLLSLPMLYLIRFWEERFIIQKEVKLKF